MPSHLIIFLGLLSVAGLLFLTKFFRGLRTAQPVDAPQSGFGPSDAVFATILFLVFAAIATAAFGKTEAISRAVLINSIAIYLVLILLILGALVASRRDPRVLFGLSWKNGWRLLPHCLAALLAVYPLILLAQITVTSLAGPAAGPQAVVTFLAKAKDWDKALLIVMVLVSAPVAEELIFRGYIYGVFRQYLGFYPALLLQAAVFAAIHQALPAIAGIFVLAIFLGVLYEKTGSLWSTICMHGVFNLTTVVIMLFFPQVANF